MQNNTWPGWKTVRMLGKGSYAEVYEIERTADGTTERAALKVMSLPPSREDITLLYESGIADTEKEATDYINDQVDVMMREIELMSAFSDVSTIVRFQDHMVIEHEGWPGADILIKMELLTPLTRYVRTQSITANDIVRIGTDMCSALEVCHGHVPKILHRDIKAANIMVSDEGTFKLGDFGVARTVDGTKSAHTMAGTENYMAPEVFKGKGYHEQADIYSLGMVLYRLLNNNRSPFLPVEGKVTVSEQLEAKQRRVSGEKLPEPCYGTRELKDVILKALEYEPDDRYESAEQFKKALEACLCDDNSAQINSDKTVSEHTFSEKADPGKAVLEKVDNTAEQETVYSHVGAKKRTITEDRQRSFNPSYVVGVILLLLPFVGLFIPNIHMMPYFMQEDLGGSVIISIAAMIYFLAAGLWGGRAFPKGKLPYIAIGVVGILNLAFFGIRVMSMTDMLPRTYGGLLGALVYKVFTLILPRRLFVLSAQPFTYWFISLVAGVLLMMLMMLLGVVISRKMKNKKGRSV